MTKELELFAYQQRGVDFLLGATRCGLFDDQGLGKTAVALVAASQIKGRVLVLAPTSVTHNWAREAKRWGRARRWNPQVVSQGSTLILPDRDLVIVPHGLVRKPNIYVQLCGEAWGALVIDEAHVFRNPFAQHTQLVYGLGKLKGHGVVRHAARVWALTGTPMPNNPLDLWSMLAGLEPSRLAGHNPFKPKERMSYVKFRDRYCLTRETRYGVKIYGAKNVEDLKTRLKGFFLRRLKVNELDLPPIRWGVVSVTRLQLPAEVRAIEEELVQGGRVPDGDALLELLGESRHFAEWRRLVGIVKAKSAVEMLRDELECHPAKKIVVFAHHREAVEIVRSGLHKFNARSLTGDTPAEERGLLVECFQNRPKFRVLVCNLTAGGVGITLTAAHDVVFVEQSFVPGENAQAADRCYRIGQKQAVLVRVLATACSLDVLVAETLARKSEMIHQALG